MENPQDNTILTPRQLGFILMLTLFIFWAFAFVMTFLGDILALIIGEALLILPALIFVIHRRLPLFSTFRLRKINGSQALATLALFAPVFVLSDELDRIVQSLFPMPSDWYDALSDLLQFDSMGEMLGLVLAGVLLAAFAEEMLFRGLIQRTLEHYREPAMAIVLSSVFFALIHFNPWTSIQILLLGLVMGYVTWKSQSILPSIIIHGMNNFLSLMLMNSAEESLAWYSKTNHVNVIWIIAATLLIVPAFRYFNRVSEPSE